MRGRLRGVSDSFAILDETSNIAATGDGCQLLRDFLTFVRFGTDFRTVSVSLEKTLARFLSARAVKPLRRTIF